MEKGDENYGPKVKIEDGIQPKAEVISPSEDSIPPIEKGRQPLNLGKHVIAEKIAYFLEETTLLLDKIVNFLRKN